MEVLIFFMLWPLVNINSMDRGIRHCSPSILNELQYYDGGGGDGGHCGVLLLAQNQNSKLSIQYCSFVFT